MSEHPHFCDCDECLNSGPWPKAPETRVHTILRKPTPALIATVKFIDTHGPVSYRAVAKRFRLTRSGTFSRFASARRLGLVRVKYNDREALYYATNAGRRFAEEHKAVSYKAWRSRWR